MRAPLNAKILSLTFAGAAMLFAGNAFRAQTLAPKGQGPAAPIPQWQIAAGGSAKFDITSVRQNKSGQPPLGDAPHSNVGVAVRPSDFFVPTGGLFSATNLPLGQYIIFAYKIMAQTQMNALYAQMPAWAKTARYDIQARADGNPNKDRFRLMTQALLSDRFKLAVHYEAKEVPALVLVLDKPGKLGPNLRRHPKDAACSYAFPVSSGPPFGTDRLEEGKPAPAVGS